MLYVVGDIHGQLAQLDRALDLIKKDGGCSARVVFLGDYTDRGPDSKGVLDRLIRGRDEGQDWTFIKGNHDRMFEWFMEDTPRPDRHLPIDRTWLHERLGGDTTLASYGVTLAGRPSLGEVHAEAHRKVPASHIEFLKGNPLCVETEHLFLVHAGIRPEVPFEDQTEHDMLWIRQGFIDDTTPHPKLVVHGHTALEYPEHAGNRINLDGGAGYGNDLWPARFNGEACVLLTDRGPVPLNPCG